MADLDHAKGGPAAITNDTDGLFRPAGLVNLIDHFLALATDVWLKLEPKYCCWQHTYSFYAKQNPVDGLELQPLVMNVSISTSAYRAGWSIPPAASFSPRPPWRWPANGSRHPSQTTAPFIFANAIFGCKNFRLGQIAQGRDNPGFQRFTDCIAAQMAASPASAQVIQTFQAGFGLRQRLDDRAHRIIDQHQDMRSSSAAPWRIFMRGGRRSTMVPSVARIRLVEPLV